MSSNRSLRALAPSTSARSALIVAMWILAAAALGYGAASSWMALAAAAAIALAAVVLTIGGRNEQLVAVACGLLVLGYAVQGRGFAYLGVAPAYVGEMVLALGIATFPFIRKQWRISWIDLCIIGFMTLGLLRTVPFLRSDGIDAVRDAAMWYYALFAFIVARFMTLSHVQQLVQVFARLLGALLIWILFMSTLLHNWLDQVPHFPGSPLPLISIMKPGDRAVVLAGIASFMLAGLYQHATVNVKIPQGFYWAIWLVCGAMVTVQSRGGLLALAVALGVVFLLRPSGEWLKVGMLGLSLLALLIVVNPSIDLGSDRQFSTDQFRTNIVSIVSESTENAGGVQGTKNWRLGFWADIANDTLRGPLFWSGNGFGENLATKYGYIVTADESLRAPHSIHFTILGRMGVPGLVIWITFLLVFFGRMAATIRRAHRTGDQFLSDVLVWLIAILCAGLTTASFDPYLEGPQGAIPFWCVVGVCIAVMRMSDERSRGQHQNRRPEHDAATGPQSLSKSGRRRCEL